MLVGAVVGIPGASYLTALHILVTGKSSTAAQVVAVVVFVIIDFALILIPFAFLELRPRPPRRCSNTARTGCWATPCSLWPPSPCSWAPTWPSAAWSG